MKTISSKIVLKSILLATLSTGLSKSAVIVSDSGTTIPTITASDTGYTAATTNRFGWDAGEGFTQTFTVLGAGIVQSIYLGYNGFNNGETITLDLLVNGNSVATGLLLDGDNFSGNSATDGNFAEFYWMEFDLSAENVAVAAGANSFTMSATADTGDSWALAPRYVLNGGYADGALSLDFGNTGGDSDLAFAVTVVPEPSGFALVVLGAFGFMVRRRR